VAELIERMLAVLIVIILLGIVLYLALNGSVVERERVASPAPVESVQFAKKEDRLREATPAELRKDWSRSPTIVVREPSPPPRVIRERARPVEYRSSDYRHSEYRHSDTRRTYRRREEPVYSYREERPVEYRDRTFYRSYHDRDCVGEACECTCERPYWSSSGPVCPD
jgi:hypothetical protein